jgi:hypothetical protein
MGHLQVPIPQQHLSSWFVISGFSLRQLYMHSPYLSTTHTGLDAIAVLTRTIFVGWGKIQPTPRTPNISLFQHDAIVAE